MALMELFWVINKIIQQNALYLPQVPSVHYAIRIHYDEIYHLIFCGKKNMSLGQVIKTIMLIMLTTF